MERCVGTVNFYAPARSPGFFKPAADVARTHALFKKADVVRLIEAVRAAGVKVSGVEITSSGTLRVLETAVREPESDFDRYEAEL